VSLSDELAAEARPTKLGAIADLLARSGIDPADIARVERVSVYEGYIKTPDGEIEKTDLHAIKLVPTGADGPE